MSRYGRMFALIFFATVLCFVKALYYDSYRGIEITIAEVKTYDERNITFWCVNEFLPCNPDEGRRVDGSCNNLEHPSRGASHTPFIRLLPPLFHNPIHNKFEPKTAASGNDLPLARYLRTRLISAGKVPSQRYTQLAVYALLFMAADGTSFHDTNILYNNDRLISTYIVKIGRSYTRIHHKEALINYVFWKPKCCTSTGKFWSTPNDQYCVPNKIPEIDPVHRFSGIRCLNMTRPESFQSIGCVPDGTIPDRIVTSTPLLDLSTVYGNFIEDLDKKGRLLKGGLLKQEVEDGRVWPPSSKNPVNICVQNQFPHETRCHEMPEDVTNTLTGINLMTTWYWRNHNFIAKQLFKINPCWDDERLFTTARDINIAMFNQINYYELMPIFLGIGNLLKDGIISPSFGFRDIYNKSVEPRMSLEYSLALRWVHSIQEGTLKMYDKYGHYLKQIPIVNLTLRTGYLSVDNNIDYITQGSFRQGCGNVDYIADPDITDRALGPHQEAADVMTNDLAKNRYFGFQPYIKYREICFGNTIRTFGDLHGIIDPERIETLRDVYEKEKDIDLMAGIWVEKPIDGGYVPSTFYCLIIDQLRRNIVSDRHWYERSKRPSAFNERQLAEIRKYTIARFLCDVGDTVTGIQPQAFLKAGPKKNRITSCSNILDINYGQWFDTTCESTRTH